MSEDAPYELSVSRHIDAAPETVWQIMTERLPEWWCPAPWRVVIDAVEWRAGGCFDTTMHGPDGEKMPDRGIFLEFTPNRRMVFTDAVDADWNPRGPFMIGIMEIAGDGNGTRYTASARHWNREAMEQHREMGFVEGWGIVADQLAAIAEQSTQEGA